MKKSIGIIGLCLVLFFTLTKSVTARNDDIYVSYILSNIVKFDDYGYLLIESYNEYIAVSEGSVSKEDYSETEALYFLETPKYNFSYYFHQLVYKDGTTITAYADNVNFSDIDISNPIYYKDD